MRILPAIPIAPRAAGGAGQAMPAGVTTDPPRLVPAPDRFLTALTRSRERLRSAQATLSRSTELVAVSRHALARSTALLAPRARGGPSGR